MNDIAQERIERAAQVLMLDYYPERARAIAKAVLEADSPSPSAIDSARAEEREACAALADDFYYMTDIDQWRSMTKTEVSADACKRVAAAIRARGTPAPAETDDEAAEARHRTMQELHEVADGAWGDGPRTRGAARAHLATSRAVSPPETPVNDWVNPDDVEESP